jgi:hypothetical protein
MPISAEDFNKGRTEDAATTQIESFLRSHPNEAFTADEITTQVSPGVPTPYKMIADAFKTTTALIILVTSGKVEQNYVTIGIGPGDFYYRIKK